MSKTAAELIAQSIEHDQIAHADWTDTLADDLEAAADDSVRNGEVTEFWGETDDGDDWRVHLRHAEIAP